MKPNDFILISTCRSNTPTATGNLLQEVMGAGACGYAFGNAFYPLVGFSTGGNIHWICNENKLTAGLTAIVIPDEFEMDRSFLRYITKVLPAVNRFFILLHSGVGNVYQDHQNQLVEVGQQYLKKLYFYEGHHCEKSILGEGLEMIVCAASAGDSQVEKMEAAFSYIKGIPEYLNFIKEDAIKLFSLIKSLIQKQKMFDWQQSVFVHELHHPDISHIASKLGPDFALPEVTQLPSYLDKLLLFIESFQIIDS